MGHFTRKTVFQPPLFSGDMSVFGGPIILCFDIFIGDTSKRPYHHPDFQNGMLQYCETKKNFARFIVEECSPCSFNRCWFSWDSWHVCTILYHLVYYYSSRVLQWRLHPSHHSRLLRWPSNAQEEYCMTLRARLQVTLAEATGKKLVGSHWLQMLFRESFQRKGLSWIGSFHPFWPDFLRKTTKMIQKKTKQIKGFWWESHDKGPSQKEISHLPTTNYQFSVENR